MKNKKYYFFLGLIFAIGFLIRILFSLNQPFWLDEKYSVFFATQFSSSELLINFSNDANPGLYYIFVKYLCICLLVSPINTVSFHFLNHSLSFS